MCEELKQPSKSPPKRSSDRRRIEPPLGALLFLILSVISFRSADGLLWLEPLPWLLLGTSAGLWRAHGWARWLAMAVLTGLLALLALPGGTDWHPVRLLLLDPWVSAGLVHHTGLHPEEGAALVAAGLLLWLLSPPVRRAFALADLEAVRASLPPLPVDRIRDDH